MPVDLELAHRAKAVTAKALMEIVDENLDTQGMIETQKICLLGIGVVSALAELLSPLPPKSVQVLMDELLRLHAETASMYNEESQTLQ